MWHPGQKQLFLGLRDSFQYQGENLIFLFLHNGAGLKGKVPAYNAGDLGSIPRLGRSFGEGNGYPLQYSGLEDNMDYTAHGVAKSW